MTVWTLAHESWLKLAEALALLLSLSLLQLAAPRRGDGWNARRWQSNLWLIVVSSLSLRLLIPISAVAVALWLEANGIGLFNQLNLGAGVELVAAIAILDLAIYWQHRAFHHFPLLWRAHRVHHSDTGFDVSLGLRFHPFEILPSMVYKLAVIGLLGASPIAVLVYEAMLLGFSLITHADIAVPLRLDRALRLVFVTPDWHRVHHSVHRAETNSNYGNILSVWDRIFGSYIPQPRDGHPGMLIGLDGFRAEQAQTVTALLRQPFSDEPSSSTLLSDDSHA